MNFWLELGGRSLQLDFYWPAQALVAELDGHATHGTPPSNEIAGATAAGLELRSFAV